MKALFPRVLLPSFLLLIIASSIPAGQSKGAKKSGSIWIVRHILTSRSAIDKAVRDLEDTGMEHAFVQVSGRLHSYFPSSILPIAEELERSCDLEDPFGYFVSEARKRKIKIHAWMNVFFAWSSEGRPKSPEHPFNKNPGWFVYYKDGISTRKMPISVLQTRDIPGYFISPVHPSFVNLMKRYVEEIVTKYEIDGIHLDYMRYPSRDTGFGEMERTLFERQYYVDPILLFKDEETLSERFGRAGIKDLKGKWTLFRAALVQDAVKSIRDVLERSGQEVTLSAAVLPDPDSARVFYGQDWESWLGENIVDFVVLMSYSSNMGQFVAFLDNNTVKSNADRIIAGISTYNQPLETALEEARFALDAGFAGVCFFSYNDLSSKRRSLQPIKQLLIDR
ncbi:MAG: glycoside hydrolase family 10 protein [Candidatus Glassbacteria bacterium]